MRVDQFFLMFPFQAAPTQEDDVQVLYNDMSGLVVDFEKLEAQWWLKSISAERFFDLYGMSRADDNEESDERPSCEEICDCG
jgi:hypothetical protein